MSIAGTMSEKELGGEKKKIKITSISFWEEKVNHLKTLILEFPGMPYDSAKMNPSYSTFTVSH